MESVFRQLVLAEMRKLDPDYADRMISTTHRVEGSGRATKETLP